MRTKSRSIFLTVVVASLLQAGCATVTPYEHATKPYVSSPNRSLANNVLYAVNIHRISDSEAESGRNGEIKGVDSKLMKNADLFVGSTTYALLNGIGAGALNALANVAEGIPEAKTPNIISWVPSTVASSPEEAKSYVLERITPSLTRAMREVKSDFEITPLALGENGRGLVGIKLSSDACSETEARTACRIGVPVFRPGNVGFPNTPQFTGVIPSALPTFIKGKGNMGYLVKLGLSPLGRGKNGPAIDSLRLWQRASGTLPDTTYLYLSPTSYAYRDDHGVLLTGQVPLVINQGKIHLFIKPS